MSETEEYLDVSTGIRLTVEYDIPDHPKLTVFAPEGCTLSIEELNEAVQRLLTSAGRMPEKS